MYSFCLQKCRLEGYQVLLPLLWAVTSDHTIYEQTRTGISCLLFALSGVLNVELCFCWPAVVRFFTFSLGQVWEMVFYSWINCNFSPIYDWRLGVEVAERKPSKREFKKLQDKTLLLCRLICIFIYSDTKLCSYAMTFQHGCYILDVDA